MGPAVYCEAVKFANLETNNMTLLQLYNHVTENPQIFCPNTRYHLIVKSTALLQKWFNFQFPEDNGKAFLANVLDFIARERDRSWEINLLWGPMKSGKSSIATVIADAVMSSFHIMNFHNQFSFALLRNTKIGIWDEAVLPTDPSNNNIYL